MALTGFHFDTEMVVGQFGTGQFGTRRIWHQTFDMIKINLIDHFWQFLAKCSVFVFVWMKTLFTEPILPTFKR